MALRMMHGFDHENASADLANGGIVTLLANGGGNVPTVALGSASSRWGVGNYLEIGVLTVNSGGDAVTFPVPGAAPSAGFAGCAAIVTAQDPGTGAGWMLCLYDAINAAVQCCARLRNDGVVEIWRGSPIASGTLLGSVANAYTPGAWQYVEFGTTIGASETATVRINGTAVLTLPGVNTQGTASTTFESVAIMNGINNATSMAMNIDDVYCCDSTGTLNNTFRGDVRVIDGFANAAGASTQFTPLAGANWQEVSEVAMDSDTSYNSSATAGAIDLFATGIVIPAGATVFGVQVSTAVRKTDSLVHTLSPLVKSGATTGTGTAGTTTSTYGYVEAMFETDPATGLGWTPAAVEAAQMGYELVS